MAALRWWVGMELARRRAGAGSDRDERIRAMNRAGDAYERGRAMLRRPGAAEPPPPTWGERAGRALGRVLATGLDLAPGLRRRIEDWILADEGR